MPLLVVAPVTGRYLHFAEREEIAVSIGRGLEMPEIPRRSGRDPSTISRKLHHNAEFTGQMAG